MFSIIIVTFNSAAVLDACLTSIPDGHEVIVVDNASHDSTEQVASQHGVVFLANAENLGFGTACNIGAAAATGKHLFFLNPDSEVEAGALETLSGAFSRLPDLGIAAPRILAADGRMFFRKRSKLYTTWPWARMKLPEGDKVIKNASGAAIAMSKQLFEDIGGFDENIFLFFEDDDLCLRVRNRGLKIYHIHDAIIHHRHGTSTLGVENINEIKEYEYYKSMIYVMKKHGRVSMRVPYILKNALKLIRVWPRKRQETSSILKSRLRGLMT